MTRQTAANGDNRFVTTTAVERMAACGVVSFLLAGAVAAQYPEWRNSGSLFILTTPEGADLPASASLEGFPLLVRLDKAWFDFGKAAPGGEDLRFSAEGKPLPYQVEAWNREQGSAEVWVRIPLIKGNEQREIRMHWGKSGAASESNGKAVFNETNGYLTVCHMTAALTDETGTLVPKDAGTTGCSGVIGQARQFDAGKGILGGDSVAGYPVGANPHSTELWFKMERQSDRVFCWGSGEPKSMVQIITGKPPHAFVDCYHGPAGIHGKTRLSPNEWMHVMHTYQDGVSRLFVNGIPDGTATSNNSPMNFKSPVQVFFGGWRSYGFVGAMDEVRVSKVARPEEWVKLQYENQKPMQAAVGPLVQAGGNFSVSVKKLEVLEGTCTKVTAMAGGARKVYWSMRTGDAETVVAVDRLTMDFDAGRVQGDKSSTLRLKAIYADGPRTIDIPVTIREDVPEPEFSLRAPANWNGRDPIEIVPEVTNLAAMRAKGQGTLRSRWNVSGPAVIKETGDGKLRLLRSQNSGLLQVTAEVDNGGASIARTVSITVREPAKDDWIERTPAPDEMPVDNQFFARDDRNEGTVFCNGQLTERVDSLFVRLHAGDKLVKTESQVPKADGRYALALKLKAGLVRYKVEFGTKVGGTETVRHTATNLVCGDAFVIDGQSNAVAYNYHNNTQRPDLIDFTSDWIRTYGSGGEAGDDTTNGGWGNGTLANVKLNNRGGVHFVGVWAMALAKRLVDDQKIPVCLINAAVGGTRIDQHMPDPKDRLNTTDSAHSIYRNLLRRVVAAKLTHGIRAVLWHQGEADQGFDGPDNAYGCENYQRYFTDLTAAWKQDFPNLRHYAIYQIWPNACGQGGTRHSDMLRDVQRRLPRLYSSLSVVPTLDLPSGASCHFVVDDYEKMGLALAPLLERDIHGKRFEQPVTAPDIRRARYATAARDQITLEFDQPVGWLDGLADQFYLDGEAGRVVAGTASGRTVTLKLAAPSQARTITYLVDRKWDRKTLLYGTNGIAALTFCEVPLEPIAGQGNP